MANRAVDAINASEGSAFLDGTEILNMISLTVEFTKNKVALRNVGRRSPTNKTISVAFNGTLNQYKANRNLLTWITQYLESGQDVYFDIIANQLDAESQLPTGDRILLKNCNIDSGTLMNIDVDGDVVREEIPFTIEEVRSL